MDAKHCFVRIFAGALCVVAIAERAMGDDADNLQEPIQEIVLFRKDPATEAREQKIAAELAKFDAARLPASDWAKEFAGVYYNDGAMGQVVAIAVAPKAGISYQVYGCLGLYEADHGDIVKVMPEGITVKWATPPDNDPKRLVSSKLYFVRWGARRYLVPERQMQALVTDYNKGGLQRARLWSIPLKTTSETVDAAARKAPVPPGRPQLPAQYARFIVDKPARLTITSLKIFEPANYKEIDVEHAIADVELVGGANQGLQVGLVIDVDNDRDQRGILKLTKVEPTKSWGRWTAPVIENRSYLPKVGSQIVLPGAQPEAVAARKTR